MGLAFALAVSAWSSPVAAQWVKLSDGLSFSDVRWSEIGPDGNRVVFGQDATVDEAVELYGVDAAGGSQILLSAVLPSGSAVWKGRFTDDGSRYIYHVDQDTLDVYELYSVPPEGGAYVKLNGPLSSGEYVGPYRLCGDLVVYQVVGSGPYAGQLFTVSTAGGSVVDLTTLAVLGSFRLSPDCTRIAFNHGLPYQLSSLPILGGTAVQLSPPGMETLTILISPNGQRVVFRGTYDATTIDEFDLYSVPITGGTAVKLNGEAVAGGGVTWYSVDPTSNRVVYMSDQDADEVQEIYSVSIMGGGATKLNGLLVSGGDVLDVKISPDGSRVVYRADQQTDGTDELYSVPIDGGGVVKLNGPLASEGDVLEFTISPDGQWVVYRADELLDGYITGFRVPIAGPSAARELIWSRPAVLESYSYLIGPRSRFVFVQGNRTLVDGVERLWQVNLAGTPDPNAVELIPIADFADGGDVSSFRMGPNGNIVYIADQDTDEEFELYGIPLVFIDGFESGDASNWTGG
jgi:Tol biopolymer transport system component